VKRTCEGTLALARTASRGDTGKTTSYWAFPQEGTDYVQQCTAVIPRGTAGRRDIVRRWT